MSDAPKPPEEKTPGEGAPDLGTERPETSSSIVETIDEIPMGGVPEPGETPAVDTGEERTGLTDMPEHDARARGDRGDHRACPTTSWRCGCSSARSACCSAA